MSLVALVTSLFVLGETGTLQTYSITSEPVVQVGVYAYQSDGAIPSRAFSTAPRDSVVWTSESLCHVGAGALHAAAAHAWRFSGKVLSVTGREAVVQLEWQRTLDRGQPVTSPGGSIQLTLRPGDRVPLDSVAPTAPGCSVANVVFEVRYEEVRYEARLTGRQAPGGGLATGAGGAGTGSATGSGGGRGSGTGAGGTGGVSGMSTGRSGGGGSTTSARNSARGLFDVDLWLVHDAPGQEAQVRHEALRSTGASAVFAFPPIAVDTAEGLVSVQISGSFDVTENGRQLVFITHRSAVLTPTGGSKREVSHTRGIGRTSSPMPGPSDVISFELPPVGIGAGTSLPDKFSVRVRITPI